MSQVSDILEALKSSMFKGGAKEAEKYLSEVAKAEGNLIASLSATLGDSKEAWKTLGDLTGEFLTFKFAAKKLIKTLK